MMTEVEKHEAILQGVRYKLDCEYKDRQIAALKELARMALSVLGVEEKEERFKIGNRLLAMLEKLA